MNPACHPAPQGGRTTAEETSVKESFRPVPREEKQDAPKPELTHPADVEQTYPGTNVDDSEDDPAMTSLKERSFRLQAAGINIGAQTETLEMKNLKNEQIMQNSRSSTLVCVRGVGQRAVCKNAGGEGIVDSNRRGDGEHDKHCTDPGSKKTSSVIKGRKCRKQEKKENKMEEKCEQTLVKESYLQQGDARGEVEKQDVEKSEMHPEEKQKQTEGVRTESDAKPHSSTVKCHKAVSEQNLSDKAFSSIHTETPRVDKNQRILNVNRLVEAAFVDDQKIKALRKKVSFTGGNSNDKKAINRKESQPEGKEVDVSEGKLSKKIPDDERIVAGGQNHCPDVEIFTTLKQNKDAQNKARIAASQLNLSSNNNNDLQNTRPNHNKDSQNKVKMAASEQKPKNNKLLTNNNSNNNKLLTNNNRNSDVLNSLYRNLSVKDKRILLVYLVQIAYKLGDGPLRTPHTAPRAGGKVEAEDVSKGQLDLLQNEKGEKQKGESPHAVDTDSLQLGAVYEKPAHLETKQSKVTDSKVTEPKVKQRKVKPRKVKQPKVKRPKVKRASTVKRRRGSKRRSGRRRHSRHGRRRTKKKNKRRRSFYKKATRERREAREVPGDRGKEGPSHAGGSGDRNHREPNTDPKCHVSGGPPQYNHLPPGGASGAALPPVYIRGDQPRHQPNRPPSSRSPARRSSHTGRHPAPYPARPSPHPGSITAPHSRRWARRGHPVCDADTGGSAGGDGESVGRGRPCSNSPPGGNTGAIGGGRGQQNGLSDSGEGGQGKDASSGSQRSDQQTPNDDKQKAGEEDKEDDSGRDGGKGEKGGGGGGEGEDGDGRREGEREKRSVEVEEINGPRATPHPWPPPMGGDGAGVGAQGGGDAQPPDRGKAQPPDGGDARPPDEAGGRPPDVGDVRPPDGPPDVADVRPPGGGGARPKVFTKKKPGRDHCQGPCRDYYRLLQRKRARAGASREDVNRACSELEKCLVKCLHRDKDPQCGACGLLHAALKHVAKCTTGSWRECKECVPVADLLIYHVEVCLAHTYAAPGAGAGAADHGRLCRNNLKLCHNLVYRIKDRCVQGAPREDTRHMFRHAIEEVWRTPGVWTRIKTYLRKVFNISLALNDSPPDAFQSGLGDQFVSVPNFFSVRITSIRDPQLSFLSSVALQQIIAAGSETEDPSSEAPQEYHSGYTSSHEWELRAQPSDNVKYGTQADLIAMGERWRQLKEARRHPGSCTTHSREEDATEQGVILAHHARHLKVQYPGGRYKRGDQWELGPVLGAGMSGRCSLALDSNTGFKFCVKEVILDKFELTEMEILTRLRHPGICLCYGAVLIGDSIYMFMEYVEGCSLQSHIGGLTRLNDMTALVYFKQLTEVLQYLQGQGILHEDIKSENILLRSGTTRLVLIDFGLARHVSAAYPQVAPNEPPVGSQTQWSPEKAECCGYGFPSDVWATACVLLEMVTGSPPWLKRYSQAASLIYVIPMNAPPLADIHDYVSQTMRDLIVWLWTMDPELRPAPLDVLQHRAFSMIDTSIISQVIKNRSILTSGSTSPIDVQDETSAGRNNTVSIGGTATCSGEVSPIERQTSSSSSGSSNEAARYPSSHMSRVEDVKTVSTPRDPTRGARGEQGVVTNSEDSVVDSGGSVPLDLGNGLKYQPERQPDRGCVSASTQGYAAGSPCDTTPCGSNAATPTHSQSGSAVQAPFIPVTTVAPIPYMATSCVLSEPTLPNLSIFDQPNDSFQSSGSSVDLAKLMQEAAGDAAVGSDDEFNDMQINSSNSSRPDVGVVAPGCGARAASDTSGRHVEYQRDRHSSSRHSKSDSDIQSEYRDLQNGLLTRAASDHPSMLEDDWDDLREEREAVYDDAQNTMHDSMTLSQNPPAATTAAAADPPAEEEAGGVLVVFVDRETREQLCQLRMYHVAEWESVVRTASSRIQPRYQDGYCVRPEGEAILDLSTSLSMNASVIQLEVWDYTGEEDWYVKNYQIMYSPHYMGAFMPQ